jgi:septal ring factor EnvC (AmiA/AmiB activator)
MTRAAVLATVCLLVLVCGAAQAAGNASASQQAQLKELRARIAKLQANLDQDIQARGQVQSRLRDSEQQIAKQADSLQTVSASVAQAQTRLATLQREQAQQQAVLDAQKTALAQQIRAAYMQGQDSRLQLLLNARDPATLDRLLAYYDYMNKARAARIQAVRTQLDTLARINTRVKQQLAALTDLRQQRGQTLAQLKTSRETRKLALAQLNKRIRSRGQQLARMQSDERHLRDLLNNLQQTLADIPADLEGHHRFSSLRGRLPWPVAGRIIQTFGAPLAGGRLRAYGDLIAAPLGTPVRAIAYGRVVFADWLPHFGLLVIIDHGGGYMSIYAHNQSVYAHVGDWVQMGETIATLGDSGGQGQAALYFEIRHRGVALSPRDWCRGRLPRG